MKRREQASVKTASSLRSETPTGMLSLALVIFIVYYIHSLGLLSIRRNTHTSCRFHGDLAILFCINVKNMLHCPRCRPISNFTPTNAYLRILDISGLWKSVKFSAAFSWDVQWTPRFQEMWRVGCFVVTNRALLGLFSTYAFFICTYTHVKVEILILCNLFKN